MSRTFGYLSKSSERVPVILGKYPDPMTRILIVGDGNFSFSLSFSLKWPEKQIVATSFQEKETLVRDYEATSDTIAKLQERGVILYYNIDATKLQFYKELIEHSFNCIIFNFPHPGGKNNIIKNKELVQGFLCSAAKVLEPLGEIWVTLCKGQGGTPLDAADRGYENSWKIVELAAANSLIITDIRTFLIQDWPMYTPTGYRGNDKGFAMEGAMTHVFTKERIDRKPWQPAPLPLRVTFCRHCCHGNDLLTHAIPPPDLASYECFHYPLLDQDWHPLTQVRNQLTSILYHSLSGKCTTQLLPHSSYPVIHSNSCLTHNNRTLELIDSEPVVGEHVLENSLKDRVHLILRSLACHHINQPVSFILSSAVYPQVTVISSHPKDQPISHQLMCLLLQEGRMDLARTIATHAIAECLRIKESDLYWVFTSNNDIGNLVRDDNDVSLVQLSPVLTETIRSAESLAETVQIINYQYFIVSLESVVGLKYSLLDLHAMWSKDLRFNEQFVTSCPTSEVVRYRPFSLFPPQYIHDVSFWVTEDEQSSILQQSVDAKLIPLIRTIAGLSVTSVQCIDVFISPKDSERCGWTSFCYRLVYSSSDRALGRHTALHLQEMIRHSIEDELKWRLR